MSSINDFMTHHHRECDEALARAEEAAAASDWAALKREAAAFFSEMARHVGVEEQVLFPAFEERTGMRGGPTDVMRGEHARMQDLIARMRHAVEASDATEYLGLSDTLQILLQQHNVKEEGVLYPMLDRSLGDDARLTARMRDFAV